MPRLPEWKTGHFALKKNGQTLRRLHQLLQRHLQNGFPTPSKRLREALGQGLQGLRLVYCTNLVERETPLEPVPKSQMPDENQEKKRLNLKLCNQELKKV